jgi:hypothetical protein
MAYPPAHLIPIRGTHVWESRIKHILYEFVTPDSTLYDITTLCMIFHVTYYLELRNVIIVYCTSLCLPTKVELVVWTL